MKNRKTNHFKIVGATVAVVGLLAAVYTWYAGRVEAQPSATLVPVAAGRTTDVYAVKFLCGEYQPQADPTGRVREGPVKPGNYQTAINIHNPNPRTVKFVKKAVLMFDSTPSTDPPPSDEFEVPMPPGHKVTAALEPDWGMEIDCPDIRTVLLGPEVPGDPLPQPPPFFIKGWVVIEVPSTPGKGTKILDVVAAYPSHGFTTDPFGNLLPMPEGFSLEVVSVTPKRVF